MPGIFSFMGGKYGNLLEIVLRSDLRETGFAERSLWNFWPVLPHSLRLDVGGADHLAPLLGFIRDKLAVVGGRADKRRAAQIGDPRLYLGIGKSRIACRLRRLYLMPAAWISFPFELSSATTYLSISAGVIGIGLIASCFSLCCIAGVASTFVAAAWNFSTIARAVWDGMNTPYQMVRSELG